MLTWYRRLGLLLCGLVAVMLLVGGCHRHKHRELRVHEETREGEVHEEQPGEMVVE